MLYDKTNEQNPEWAAIGKPWRSITDDSGGLDIDQPFQTGNRSLEQLHRRGHDLPDSALELSESVRSRFDGPIGAGVD